MSFLSPCMLPMLPVYLGYFAGNAERKQNVLVNSLSFVCGFALVFGLLGVFAGTLGRLLAQYRTVVDVICGVIVILFGLSCLNVIRLPFLSGMKSGRQVTGAFSALVFGLVYAVSLSPCVGAFLGSALMMASASATALQGLLLLLSYSLGIGVPFVLSAVLIRQLEGAMRFIKRHYTVINTVCGIFLILVGLAMCFGLMNRFLLSVL